MLASFASSSRNETAICSPDPAGERHRSPSTAAARQPRASGQMLKAAPAGARCRPGQFRKPLRHRPNGGVLQRPPRAPSREIGQFSGPTHEAGPECAELIAGSWRGSEHRRGWHGIVNTVALRRRWFALGARNCNSHHTQAHDESSLHWLLPEMCSSRRSPTAT